MTKKYKPRSWMEWSRQFALRPLRNDTDLNAATAVLGDLLKECELGEEGEDYLNVLGDLIWNYENVHFAFPSIPDAKMLRRLLNFHQVTEVELAQASGLPETTIARILANKRPFSRRHINAICKALDASPLSFDGR